MMQEQLIIYLNIFGSEQPSWVLVDEQGAIKETGVASDNELATLAMKREVTIVVPAENVLLTKVQLPKMNRNRLLQALPYALEEEVIDEVEGLHFAVGDYSPDFFPVAVVAKEKMQNWLNLLKKWGVKANRLCTTTFALPASEDEWHVFITNMANVRFDQFNGMSCDLPNLLTLLRLAIASAKGQLSTIIIHNYTSQPIASNWDLSIPLHETLKKPTDLLADMTQQLLSSKPLNLLQATYAARSNKKNIENKLKQWALFMGLATMSLLLVGPAVSYVILKQRTLAINQEINKIYYENFPKAKSVVAPKLRMQEKLKKLSSVKEDHFLLLLLGHVGNAMTVDNKIKLKKLNYQNNQLSLELTANSSDDFSSFSERLQQKGLRVKQQNADLNGSQVTATLLIE